MKQRVCILFGGRSQEHEVSLQSAASVWKVISRDKFDVVLIGIERDGAWHLQDRIQTRTDRARGEYLVIRKNLKPVTLIPGQGLFFDGKKLSVDIFFPVLHGSFGEDGTLQGLLDMLGIPYVGAGVLGSALSMDKEKTKRIWRDNGLPIVDFISVTKNDYLESEDRPARILSLIEENLSYPVFVKPASTGSSVGVGKAETPAAVSAALEEAFRYDVKALIESGVDAREIECAVIGNDTPRAFPPGEVVVHHSFYSYEAKYLDPAAAKTVIPADIPPETAEQAMHLARCAYASAAVDGLARVDLFLDRRTGTLMLNEINTLPGFTNISMFPRLCEAGGLAYADLIETLIEYGLSRHAVRAGIVY